jgi:hypothetical protein
MATQGHVCNPFNSTDAYTINCTVVAAVRGGEACDHGGKKRRCIKYESLSKTLNGTVWIDDPEVIIDGESLNNKHNKHQRIQAR